MSFEISEDAVSVLSQSHQFIDAVGTTIESASDLVAHWPLQTAQEMENDAKYAEDLQVRFTRMMARILLDSQEEIDSSVAEAVYEGMDWIPGCSQEVVDALMDANQAYDDMSVFSETTDTELFFEAAKTLGISIDASTETELRETLPCAIESMNQICMLFTEIDAGERHNESAVEQYPLIARYLASQAIFDVLMNIVCRRTGNRQERAVRALPVLLYINEMRELLGVPHTALNEDELAQLIDLRASAYSETAPHNDFNEQTFCESVKFLAPIDRQEWADRAHKLEWDPKKAEQEAKEADELKSKKALEEKFKHVKDDPNKPHIEL